MKRKPIIQLVICLVLICVGYIYLDLKAKSYREPLRIISANVVNNSPEKIEIDIIIKEGEVRKKPLQRIDAEILDDSGKRLKQSFNPIELSSKDGGKILAKFAIESESGDIKLPAQGNVTIFVNQQKLIWRGTITPDLKLIEDD